ncbi:MAG TPA: ATP-binding protein [Steroidobacteraceae bacterium]|nr:ATP-binding protein [Steroidobacteraceae bacterium]
MGSTHDNGGSRPRKARAVPPAAENRAGRPGRRAADRYALALDAAGFGALEWDASSDVLEGSERFAMLLGGSTCVPRTLADLLARVHPEDRGTLERKMRSASAEGRDAEAEFRVMRGAGVLWIHMRMGAIRNRSGEGTSLLGIAEDISARKRSEADHEALVRRERELRSAAEQANRSKDEFLSMFSHELRSPLNAILGWNSILAARRAGDVEIGGIVARIERSAKTQLKMVNDLLDLGRISTGKLKIEPRPIRLAPVVIAALEAMRPAASAKDIELTSSVCTEPDEVFGDPDRLQQVVWNLLSNAVKFTDAGGRIEVSLRAVEGGIELDVTDGGQGISPELLPHVFDRFRQGDSSTTRHTSGLGLGLALVREIVALHGGSVSAASKGVGHGAAFTVRLPVLRARQGSRVDELVPSQGVPPRSLEGLSILVVDDEADARTVVAETLRLEGALVTVSASAAEAFAKLHSGGTRYDVVVTDIGMPAEDGYSLVRKLRRLPFGEGVIAIALTGYASQRDRETAIRAGFDVHVAKPVDFDRFVPLIARMTRAARGAREH